MLRELCQYHTFIKKVKYLTGKGRWTCLHIHLTMKDELRRLIISTSMGWDMNNLFLFLSPLLLPHALHIFAADMYPTDLTAQIVSEG